MPISPSIVELVSPISSPASSPEESGPKCKKSSSFHRFSSSTSSSSKEEVESWVSSPLGLMLVKGKNASGGPSTLPANWSIGAYIALIMRLAELLIIGDISSSGWPTALRGEPTFERVSSAIVCLREIGV